MTRIVLTILTVIIAFAHSGKTHAETRGLDAKARARLRKELNTAKMGGADTGGGNALSCPGWLFLGKDVMLADRALAEISEQSIDYFDFLDEGDYIKVFARRLNQTDPGLGDRLVSALSTLRFEFRSGDLPKLNDSRIVMKLFMKPGIFCSLLQLGVQDYATNTVHVDQRIYSQLSESDRYLFKIHEGLIKVWNMLGHPPADNYQVREKMMATLEDKGLFREALRMVVEEKGGRDVAIAWAIGRMPTHLMSWDPAQGLNVVMDTDIDFYDADVDHKAGLGLDEFLRVTLRGAIAGLKMLPFCDLQHPVGRGREFDDLYWGFRRGKITIKRFYEIAKARYCSG